MTAFCLSPPTGSFQRKREGGFSFEVQQMVGEGFGWGLPVKAFSRRVVVAGDEVEEALLIELGEVGLSGQEAAHASDGVLDAAFLPRSVRIAEEGLYADGFEVVVAGELGAIVEGDGAAERLGQSAEGSSDGRSDRLGVFGRQGTADQGAAHSLVQHEQVLAVAGKGHQVGFPVAWDQTLGGLGRALRECYALRHFQGWTAALPAAPAALELGAGQVMAP